MFLALKPTPFAIPIAPHTPQLYKDGFGMDFDKYYEADHQWKLPLAATYVVSKGGVIKKAFLETDYTKRASAEEIIAALKH